MKKLVLSLTILFALVFGAKAQQGDLVINPDTLWFYHNGDIFPRPVLLLLDLHTGFSGDRKGGLVFPFLKEFSTDYCDPHSQRL